MFLIALGLICFFVRSFSAKSKDPLTCGSTIKLLQKSSGYNLHSHPVAWGSGSGQQSVTTHSSNNDANSNWVVKEGHNGPLCEAGNPIRCGTVIRLEHAITSKNLHSHLFKAPLSGNQEVSGYGDNGFGDTGDNWEIVCDAGEEYWKRDSVIQLKHVDTGKFLTSSESSEFNQGNCGGQCPIMGQREVSATSYKDKRTQWVSGQGLYFPGKLGGTSDEDDEL